MTVIVYPDNSLCVDGKFVADDVRKFGIPHLRPAATGHDAERPICKRVDGMQVIAFRQPTEFGQRVRNGKLSSSLGSVKKNAARDTRLRQQHEAIYAEYCILRSNGARHDEICMALSRQWVYAPKRINMIVCKQMQGK